MLVFPFAVIPSSIKTVTRSGVRYFILAAFGMLSFFSGRAQAPGLQWARALNGAALGTAYPESIITDATKNVYTVGSFQNTIDADPGAGVFPLTSAGNSDIFVSKLDASGNFVWAIRIGGTGPDIANAIAVDNAGLVYVTGSYSATVDFDPGPGTSNLIGGGAFAFRLNSNGTLSWAGRIGSGSGSAIAVDLSNKLIIAGTFTGSSDFDPGAGTTTLTSAGSTDIFVSKFFLDGTLDWANRMGGIAADFANGMDTDASNNIYTTGTFGGTADFNPGGAVNNLISAGSSDIYMSKLDAAGAYVSAVSIGGAGSESAKAIAVDGANDVLVTGNFAGTLDFDPGGSVSNLTSTGSSDIFVLKLTPALAHTWSRNMGGPSSDIPSHIAVDAAGGVYTTGYFYGTADFDPGASAFNLLSGTGNQEAFISKLTPAGNFAWATRTESSAGGETEGVAVALDLAGDILVAGWFELIVDFDASSCVYNLPSNGDDIFVMKLSPASLGCIPPAIISFSPATGPVGSTVTIDGLQFSPTPSNNTVYFGSARANVSAATSTSLTVTVPIGATFAPITVAVGGAVAYSQRPFVVNFADGGVINSCSFSAPTNYSSGNFGYGLATGDLDLDGKVDIVVSNPTAGTLMIFRNTSTTGSIDATSFAASVDLSAGTNVQHVVVSDVDGDGKLDLVAAGFDSNIISIYRNIATPGSISAASFDARVDLATGARPFDVEAADLDGDGKTDIVTSTEGRLSFWRNIGTSGSLTTGSFDARQDIFINSINLAVSDLNVDGKPDLIISPSLSSFVRIYRNISTPGSLLPASFAAGVDFSVGAWPDYIVTGDLDNDQRPEIITSSWPGGSISILKNTSTPGTIDATSFAPKVDIAGLTEPRGLSITDYDGDSKPDIALAMQISSHVNIYKNVSTTGSITAASFAPVVDFPAGGNLRLVTSADFDGDGKPDLATSNWSGPPLTVLRNQAGTPTITSATPSSGIMGTVVTITGTNFSTTPSDNVVKFNSLTATVLASTSTSITAIVPTNATTGPLTVTRNCITVTSGTFTVLPYTPPCTSVLLNGAADKISFTDQPSLEPAAVTVEAWVKVNAFTSTKSGGNSSAQFILFKRNQLTVYSEGYSFVLDESSKLFLGVVSSGAGGPGSQRILSTSTNFVNLGQWYHLALTADNMNVSFYVNGELIGTVPTGFALNYGPEGLSIGNTSPLNSWQGAFNGSVDEVRIWNFVRSQAQLQSTLTAPLIGSETGLVAYYKMDESGQGAGIVIANSAIATGAANNGVTVGSSTTPVFAGACSCIPTSERNALIALYNSTGGASWSANTNWLSPNEASWLGVVTTGCHITEVNLPFNNMVGSIPPEIGDLTELTTLRLSSNQLSGSLPAQITNLTHLEYLFINNNSIGGALPASIGNMTSLKSIGAEFNLLTGAIPASLANCTALANLNLEGNQQTGSIPAFIGTNLFNLQTINLAFNLFDGNIPPEMGNLANLNYLSLAGNQLYGNIPTELGNLDQLSFLDLSQNQLDGQIPSSLGTLPLLSNLRLNANYLYGTIPNSIGTLSNLMELNLENNQLDVLPSNLGNLSQLQILFLGHNAFSGSLPPGVESLPMLEQVSIVNNAFDDLPVFTSTALTLLAVEHNALDFGDLEPNAGVSTFTTSPQALLPPGGNLTFNVGSAINIPFATPGTSNYYQWYKNGQAIPGANSASFNIPSASLTDAGLYVVRVTSGAVSYAVLESMYYSVTTDPCSAGPPRTAGAIDASFDPLINSTTSVHAMALQSTGKILVSIPSTYVNSNPVEGIIRFNTNGSLDNSFALNSYVLSSYNIDNLIVQPNDKILLAYSDGTYAYLVRLNADGTPDNGFNSNVPQHYAGAISGFGLQPDGKIVYSFTDYSGAWQLIRLNADGTTDGTFNAPTDLYANQIIVQPDGHILLGESTHGVLRLAPDGTLDGSFNENTSNGTPYDIALQPDGKVIVVGDFTYMNEVPHVSIARFNGDGTLDDTFVATGLTEVLFSIITTVVIQPDGKILLSGVFDSVNGASRKHIIRLNGDGTVDCGFDPLVSADQGIFAMTVQPDGNILAAGDFSTYEGVIRNGFVRILNGVAAVLPPTITSFSPSSGPVGTTVTITGTNFSATPVDNTVYFGATKASVSAATTTQLTVSVPAGATYQPISATVNGLTAYSSLPFTVTFPSGPLNPCATNPKVDFAVGAQPYEVVLGDLDGDGKTDMIAANYNSKTISVFRNISTAGSITPGSFQPRVDFVTTGGPANPRGIALGDLDGDGKLDLVVTNYADLSNATISIFRNVSTSGSFTSGSFAPRVEFTCVGAFMPAIQDLDGDGKPEIAVTTYFASAIAVFHNQSSPGTIDLTSFGTQVDFATLVYSHDIAIHDMDRDGKPDLLASNIGNDVVTVLRNTSTTGTINASSFASHVDFATGTIPYYFTVGDLDNDQRSELIATGWGSATMSILHNISVPGTINTSSFAPKVDFPTGASPTGVAVSDLNGDGKPDLVVSNNGATLSVFSNTVSTGSINSGSFSPAVDYPGGAYGVAIGDLDGDGKPELVSPHFGLNYVSVLRNAVLEEPVPTVSSFAPTTGTVGTPVTISGTNFSTTPASNIVLFNGIPATVTASTSTSITTSVPAGATTGLIQVTVGCSTGTSSGNFTVVPPATINITLQPADAIVCEGVIANFTTAAAGTTNLTFQWQFSPDGIVPFVDIINGGGYSNVTTPTLSINTTLSFGIGRYRCRINGDFAPQVITNDEGLFINLPPAAPGVSGNSGCASSSIVLTATGASPGEYRWYTVVTGGPAIAGQVNDTFVTPPITVTTNYFVAINNGTCESTRTSVTATVIPLPTSPAVTAGLGCSPSALVVLNASGGSTGQYRWYTTPTGGAPITGETNSSYVTPLLTLTTTFYVSINNGTCESLRVPVDAQLRSCTPSIMAASTQTPIGSSVTIDIAPLVTVISDPIDISSIKVITQPLSGATATVTAGVLEVDYTGVAFAGTDHLTIEACDIASHCAQEQISIEVVGDITVYNAVSPNGDGLNDEFIIQYIEALPDTKNNKVTIFNRWGTVVFDVENYDNQSRVFRGLSNSGAELPTGTYFYKLEFPGGAPAKTGFISLRR